ncbi:GNAT family N-acetyltransferase, partial [Aduncisulcus paluster]
MHALKLDQQFYISDSQDDIQLDRVCRLLWGVHWAANRPEHVIKKSIENSKCFGVFDGHMQIGFARVITDYCTYAYISDVVIDGQYRGKKLGY